MNAGALDNSLGFVLHLFNGLGGVRALEIEDHGDIGGGVRCGRRPAGAGEEQHANQGAFRISHLELQSNLALEQLYVERDRVSRGK